MVPLGYKAAGMVCTIVVVVTGVEVLREEGEDGVEVMSGGTASLILIVICSKVLFVPPLLKTMLQNSMKCPNNQ